MKIDMELPDWAVTVAQDLDGEIYVYDCPLEELGTFSSHHSGGTKSIPILGDFIEVPDFKQRKFDLTQNKVVIRNGLLCSTQT